MKRLFSIVLSVFLIFSANSVAFAYEYDFSTDLEKFTENVSELIAESEAVIPDNESDEYSCSSGIYFSSSDNNSNSKNELTTSYTNRLIVKSSEEIDTLNAVSCVNGYNDLYILQFSNSEDYLSAYEYYSRLESVEYLQEDLYCSVQTEEESTTDLTEGTTEATTETVTEEPSEENNNDEVLFNPTQTQSDIFGFASLRSHLAEEGTTYSDTIEVAVLDTGVANNHVIFENRIEPTGFNSIDSADDCFDDFGHGTHVAGIIAANTPDNVIIKPYKVLDDTGLGTDLQVYLGIEQAIADGVDVINLSLSRRGYSTVLYEAIIHAEENGIIVVASAGNKGVNLSEISYSPADFEEVVTVASCTDDFQLSDFSNYGGETDIAAPGNSINSAAMDGGYTVKSGTSMSAGFISAAVSYLLLQFPEYSRSEIESALYNNGKPCITTTTSVNYIYAEYLTKEKEPSTNPVFSYTKSLFSDPFELEITCEDEEAEIYYRTSMMSEGEYHLYTEPIAVNHDLSVFAFTISKGSNRSTTVGYTYTRRPPTDTSIFTVDSNGVLTAYTGTDTDVVLPNMVNAVRIKSVAEDVFKGNTNITSIALPAYATSIPDNAFAGCTNLKFVRIKAVTSVGNNAFKGCTALKCVVSDKLTSVGDFAFYDCSNLSSFVFTVLTDIGESAFENTSSLEIVGVNSFTNISKRAFCNSTVTEISLNNALTIGEEAFLDCKNLKFLSCPRVTNIGQGAFSGCDNIISFEFDSLTNLSGAAFKGVETLESFSANSLLLIPDDAFKNCTALTDISFDSVETIGSNAFYNTKIENAVFDNATYVGENAFGCCPDLVEISFNNLDSVDFGMFLDSPDIKSISFEKVKTISYDTSNEFSGLHNYFPKLDMFSMPLLEVVPENMFKNSKLTDLIFTNLKKVGEYAFYNSSVTSVDLSGVSEVGEYAFYNCDILTEVLLPEATYIGEFAFSECDNITSFEANLLESFDFDVLDNSVALLETLSLDSAYSITKSGSSDFTYSQFPELVNFTANRITSLQDSAFENCKNLRNVNIESAETIGNKAFKNSGVADVIVSGATSIGEECFRGCLRLTNIDLTSTESIGDLAFFGCSNITDFSAGSIDEFDLNTLYGCVKLKSLSIDGAESVKGLDFSELNTLENLWPLLKSFSANSLPQVPQYMFCQFKNVENISLDSITEIPESTFNGTTISIAEFPAVISVSDMAFAGCSVLETVKLDNATSIGKDIFNGCSAIKTLSFNKLEEIPTFDDYNYTFSGNTNLESISMDSLTVAPDNVFNNCDSLISVSMDSIEIIPDKFFYGCSNLNTISLDSVTDIGNSAFAYTDLSKTSFDSLQRIGKYAFESCRHLTSFDFSALESIGDYAFRYSGLTSVVMDSPTKLGVGVFVGCSSIKEFDFYDMPNLSATSLYGGSSLGGSCVANSFSWGGVKEVPASFFANCSYLQNVVLYDAEVIGEHAFENCKYLTSIDIPYLKVLKDYAFYNCTALKVGDTDISDLAEELGAYSITKTKNTSSSATHSVVFEKLKVAHENSFSNVNLTFAKFPVIEEIYDLPESKEYILIGSVVKSIDCCDDISSKVIAVEGTPVLEYSERCDLGWLPYNSENATISTVDFNYIYKSWNVLDEFFDEFQVIGFDNLDYQWYSASESDFSDEKPINTQNLSEVEDNFIYCVATSTENGKVHKLRSELVVVVDNVIECSEGTSCSGDYIYTDKSACLNEFDLISAIEGFELNVTPSFDSGSAQGFGTGTKIKLYYDNDLLCSFTEIMRGDLTCDGTVDVLDAARFNSVYFYYNEYEDLIDTDDTVAADMNGDWELSTDDYQLLVNKILSK